MSLSYSKRSWHYQLHQFPLQLPNPAELSWIQSGKCIRGNTEEGTVIEWYGESGGQLKYYPRAVDAVWHSDLFELEPLGEVLHGIERKAEAYFPERWSTMLGM